MRFVFLAAIGVGTATVFGSLLGFCFKNISHKFSDIVLSFASGVMLSASILVIVQNYKKKLKQIQLRR